jgi:hypothetical protein
MQLSDALDLARLWTRQEVKDHAFGDAEVAFFDLNGNKVAVGYFSSKTQEVWVKSGNRTFVRLDACALRDAAKLTAIHRNDTGEY